MRYCLFYDICWKTLSSSLGYWSMYQKFRCLGYTVEPLNTGHIGVLKNLSVIDRCPLLGGNLKKIATFGTFFHYSWHVRNLGCLLLEGFTVLLTKKRYDSTYTSRRISYSIAVMLEITKTAVHYSQSRGHVAHRRIWQIETVWICYSWSYSIDDFSRKIIWLNISSSNNNPASVAWCFIQSITELGRIPKVIREERG